MRILISNDDGIAAKGLGALADALAKKHDVVVAAPMEEQSGMAHALHVHAPIEVARDAAMEEQKGVEAWKIGGTPTDCVKLYLEALAEEKPDIVLSGINHGANLGTDVLYSGTVGAAMEGFLHDIPAVAISLDYHAEHEYEEVAELAADYLEKIYEKANAPFFLNINFPKKIKETRFVYTALGKRDYINAFERHEENGRVYYTVAGEIVDTDVTEATDLYAVQQGWISVTPLHVDLTDYMALDARL